MKMKSLDALKDVRHKFVEQEDQANLIKAQEQTRKQEADRELSALSVSGYEIDHDQYRRRDLMIQKLLTVALEHVTKLESPKTATKILSRAVAISPSAGIKRYVSSANQSLKNFMRVSRKKKTRFGKYNPTHAKAHWMDKFHESIQEALLEVQTDVQKREGNFFHSLIEHRSSLPIELPATKKHTFKKSPVMVTIRGNVYDISKHVGPRVIEGRLVMLSQAHLIGINTNKDKATKAIIAKANALAATKYGATVYDKPIHRPSKNILWFLVLDFGFNVDTAIFAEDLSVAANVEGVEAPYQTANLSDYVQRFNQMMDRKQKINLQVQRTNRLDFEAKFSHVYEDLEHETRRLEVLVEIQRKLEKEFASLTSPDGEPENGLSLKQYYSHHFDNFFHKFMRSQIATSINFTTTRYAVFEQKMLARYTYHVADQVRREATKARYIIKAIRKKLEEEKLKFLA